MFETWNCRNHVLHSTSILFHYKNKRHLKSTGKSRTASSSSAPHTEPLAKQKGRRRKESFESQRKMSNISTVHLHMQHKRNCTVKPLQEQDVAEIGSGMKENGGGKEANLHYRRQKAFFFLKTAETIWATKITPQWVIIIIIILKNISKETKRCVT